MVARDADTVAVIRAVATGDENVELDVENDAQDRAVKISFRGGMSTPKVGE